MPQSLTQILLHIIFSTKRREPVLNAEIRPNVWRYLGGTLNALKCPAIIIGGVEDHVHIFCHYAKDITVIRLIEEIKTESSKWIKREYAALPDFHWQNGYAAFSIGASARDDLYRYIENQEKHHQKVSFQDELRAFFKKYDVEFDERYVWD